MPFHWSKHFEEQTFEISRFDRGINKASPAYITGEGECEWIENMYLSFGSSRLPFFSLFLEIMSSFILLLC